MRDGEHWSVLVTEMVATFRQALIALTVPADRLKLSWRDLDAHDLWEEMAERLFEILIGSNLALDPGWTRDSFPLARYDFNLHEYSELSRVVVLVEEIDVPLTLIRFSSDDSPFSTVEAVEVSDGGHPGRYHFLPWSDELVFQIIRRRRDGTTTTVGRITPVE